MADTAENPMHATLDTRDLRNALGTFATGVCLVSVNDAQAGALAMTVNSFASVSLEPPLVLWSIQNSSECFREYTQCEHYGISVLSAAQRPLSERYARRAEHAIDSADFAYDVRGVPLLRDALATFSRRRHVIHDGGDHQIIVGEVLEFTRHGGDALVFHAGAYGGFMPAPVADQ
jgi:flavin reductase (DIM6/NTAB) family NADH-FMN oxidoreductase RutF